MYKYRGSEKMKKQNKFFGYLLIAIGVFYLLHHLDFAILQNYYSWPTLLAIIGVVFLIHSYSEKEYQHIFTGTLLVGRSEERRVGKECRYGRLRSYEGMREW